MYQQVILDHAKKPHGRVAALPDEVLATDSRRSRSGEYAVGARAASRDHGDHCAATSHQVNPTCGDEITLSVQVKDGNIVDVAWAGQGCSISQASASVMTDLVKDQPVAEAQQLEGLFHQLMNSRGKGLDDDAAEDELGDAIAFTGTSQYPARIKCALLGWMALKDALAQTAN